ncbi:MAG TPA: PspA/IM30 family protein [candidate division Zixibacteria bacterium]|nr:PspA/IM30 family protein [candidate division Zixibacteria bacterium]
MVRLIKKLKRGFDTLMAPAEDPRLTYNQTCDRQRLLLTQIQLALQNIAGAKEMLESKAAEVRIKMPQMEEQARQLLENGKEDLARLVLRRYQLITSELQRLEKQLCEVEQEEHRLRYTEQRLTAQIEDFYTRMEFIAARYSAAEAQVEISESLTAVSDELVELGREMEQAERKSEYMQARAAAIDQLVAGNVLDLPGSSGDRIESNLALLDIDQDVELHLLALKGDLA